MGEWKEKDVEAGNPTPPSLGQAAEKEDSVVPEKSKDADQTRADETSDTDDTHTGSDHGVPDIDHEEAEEAVLGRDLDRQLSRVGLPLPRSVSPRQHRRVSSLLTRRAP